MTLFDSVSQWRLTTQELLWKHVWNKLGNLTNITHPCCCLTSIQERETISQMLQKRENFVLVLQIFVFKCCKHFTLIASRPWQVVQAVAMAESIAICQYLLRPDFPPDSWTRQRQRTGRYLALTSTAHTSQRKRHPKEILLETFIDAKETEINMLLQLRLSV